jgi:hypothetical protein
MLKPAFIVCLTVIAAFGCKSQRAEAPSTVSRPGGLLGKWKLKSVGGKAPATISIKSWQVEFREQGQWQYSGEMSGQYAGMKLSGSGTWLEQGEHLEYTAGAGKGKTTVHFDADSLILSPDPVLVLNGREPVDTRYVIDQK